MAQDIEDDVSTICTTGSGDGDGGGGGGEDDGEIGIGIEMNDFGKGFEGHKKMDGTAKNIGFDFDNNSDHENSDNVDINNKNSNNDISFGYTTSEKNLTFLKTPKPIKIVNNINNNNNKIAEYRQHSHGKDGPADADHVPVILLDSIGSIPINISLLLIAITIILTYAYIFVVVSTSVQLCDDKIWEVGGNSWYEVIIPGNPFPLYGLAISQAILQQVLTIESTIQGRKLLQENSDQLTPSFYIPWCAWCTGANLSAIEYRVRSNLSMSLENVTQDELEFNNLLSDLNLIQLTYSEFFFSPEPPLQPVTKDITAACDLMFVSQIITSLRATQYRNISSPGNAGIGTQCLLGTHQSPFCEPCGNLTSMNITLLHLSENKTYGIFQDNLDGIEFDSLNTNVLLQRCAIVKIAKMIDECVIGENENGENEFRDLFVGSDELAVEKTVTGSSDNTLAGISSSFGSGAVEVPDNQLGGLVGNVIDYAKIISPFTKTLRVIQQSIEGQSTPLTKQVFEDLYERCSGPILSILDFVSIGSTTKFFPKGQVAFESVGVCWAAYTLFFLNKKECMRSTTPLAFENFEEILNLTSIDYFTPILWGQIHPPEENSTLIRDGYQATNRYDFVAWNESNDGGFDSILPGTLEEFSQNYSACFQEMEKAPEDLRSFLDLLDNIEECSQPAKQLMVTGHIETAIFFFLIIVLTVQVYWYFRGKRTPFSFSTFLFSLSAAFSTHAGFLFSGLHRSNIQALKERNFFRS